MRLFFKFADALLAFAKLMTILIMAGMTISVLIGVFFRYVIPVPMAWPPEAARFMMVAVTMFASSIAIRQLEHVGITIIVDALPRAVRTGLYLLGIGLTAAFLAVFIAYSYRLTFEMGPRQVSSSLGLSMVVAYVAMPLGGLMMLVQLIAATLEAMRRARAGQSPFVAGSGIS